MQRGLLTVLSILCFSLPFSDFAAATGKHSTSFSLLFHTGKASYSYLPSKASLKILSTYGKLVVVGGLTYWKPLFVGVGWTPYKNGYWRYDSVYGRVWVSLDAWGKYTNHHGYWRAHQVHGWIWRPLPHKRWVPHTATFFVATGGLIGWCPYYPRIRYLGFYRHGSYYGFIDGFWFSYWKGVHFGFNNSFQSLPSGLHVQLGFHFVKKQKLYDKPAHDEKSPLYKPHLRQPKFVYKPTPKYRPKTTKVAKRKPPAAKQRFKRKLKKAVDKPRRHLKKQPILQSRKRPLKKRRAYVGKAKATHYKRERVAVSRSSVARF